MTIKAIPLEDFEKFFQRVKYVESIREAAQWHNVKLTPKQIIEVMPKPSWSDELPEFLVQRHIWRVVSAYAQKGVWEPFTPEAEVGILLAYARDKETENKLFPSALLFGLLHFFFPEFIVPAIGLKPFLKENEEENGKPEEELREIIEKYVTELRPELKKNFYEENGEVYRDFLNTIAQYESEKQQGLSVADILAKAKRQSQNDFTNFGPDDFIEAA